MSEIQQLQALASQLSILYAEDEMAIQEQVANYLGKLFKEVYVASNGEEALKIYEEKNVDILLTDIHMPKMNGLQLIEKIKEINKEQEFIIISAFSETEYFINAINKNVHSYIIKPINYDQFNQALLNLCAKINLQKQNFKYKTYLEDLVEEKTQEFKENFEHTIESLVTLIEMRDSYTAGHSKRVAHYSSSLAKQIGLADEQCELLYRAGILHDIGKISTPDTILLKPDRLTDIERSLIETHVSHGYEMLQKIPMYKELAEIMVCHHERYDGKGYPAGLTGDEIPLLGHIMIIADAFDAMTSNRVYKKKLDMKGALEEIRANSAKQFHPDLVEPACEILQKVFKSDTVNTLPETLLQQQRMAYHFLDPISQTYNFKYLLFLLKEENASKRFRCLHFIKFEDIKNHHTLSNWIDADKMLTTLAEEIRSNYKEGLVFRIHGANFVLLNKEHKDIDKSILEEDAIVQENMLQVKFVHIDLLDYKNLSDTQLKEIFNDSNFF